MTRIALAVLLAASLGGCIYEAPLKRHLYDPAPMKIGPQGPQAAVLVPEQEAPPMRDPEAEQTDIPAIPPDNGASAPTAPATPQ